MDRIARAVGLAVCLLVLLTTCSAPAGRGVAISGFVALPTPVLGPTLQPTVTALPGTSVGAPTPTLSAPLSAMMRPDATGQLPVEVMQRAALMNAYMTEQAQQGAFSGAVLVSYKGRVLLSQGYGLANREEGTPARATTRFRLASVTKPLTALGVLRLVAKGQLRLDAPICQYFDPCPAAWQPLTLTHLLQHSSGLPDYADFVTFPNVEQLPATPNEVIARFRDLPLEFVPGTLYDYSNSNYVLLSQIIERTTGKSYSDYMRDEIFRPLNMTDSGVDPGDFSPLGTTRGYAAGTLDIPINVSNLYGAGNIYSTVEDLNRLAQALDAGTLLPAELMNQMMTPVNGRYGLGWMIEQRGPNRLVYHPGSISGAATWFGRYPEVGLTVIVLSNDYYANVYAIADALAAQILT